MNMRCNNKLYLPIASFILIACFTMFVLEKSHLINLYTKPINSLTSKTSNTRPVNDIDYTIQKSDTDTSINSEKQKNSSADNQRPTSNNTNIFITRASYNSSTKTITVGTLLEGVASSGECVIELIYNGTVKQTQKVGVAQQGSYFMCQGFTLDTSSLSSGQYTIKLNFTDGSSNDSTVQEIDI